MKAVFLEGRASLARYGSLERSGWVVPRPDVVIAQCALEHEATLVSLDEHFRLVPKLKGRKEMPKWG